MAKNAYFHLLTADNDDQDLGAAKVMGYVPPTCLLGGNIVWTLIAAREKPCASCNGPREKCKGSPKESGDEAGQRREVDRLTAIFSGDTSNLSSFEALWKRL